MQDDIEVFGLRFRVDIEHDENMGAPWEEHDGHGSVSEWTRRDKRPGERVLCGDRHGSRRFYDVQESMRIAKRDRWGYSAPGENDRENCYRTPGQIAALAVGADFDRLRAWCNDDWHWVGVVVTLLGADGEPTDETESLWGIESDSPDYLGEVAHELAEQIVARRRATRHQARG